MLKMFERLYIDLEERHYFEEALGYEYDFAGGGRSSGTVGRDISSYFMLKLRKSHLWPISECCLSYNESDLFDVIELLYDLVSQPLEDSSHNFEPITFSKRDGQVHYRSRINELLNDYQEGYDLSRDGEILNKALNGTETLLNSKPPTYDTQNIDNFIREAVNCYKRSRSSLTDKRHAVKTLADVLEFLRPKIKAVLTTADEKDLFNIANNFGIRHHNKKQKTDYDQEVWLDWMFYYYLATIKAIIRLIKKRDSST